MTTAEWVTKLTQAGVLVELRYWPSGATECALSTEARQVELGQDGPGYVIRWAGSGPPGHDSEVEPPIDPAETLAWGYTWLVLNQWLPPDPSVTSV